jgi:RNA polymerase primary sigma factor
VRYAAAQSLGPAVKRLIRTAKKRGYVTHDQINSVLPSDGANSEQIEDIAMFSKMGVNVVQTEEASESEIAIAKRIEAGREAMIAGLCESLLTFQAIIIWRDGVNEGKVFLRDIIDLDASYGGPDTQRGEDDLDEDDMENWLPVAAIEAELKPKVLETFDNIADAYKRLRRLHDQDIEFKLKNTTLSPAQERRYKKLKDEIIAEVKSLRLNQNRINALVEQLYDINKRLVSYEGRLMRLAESLDARLSQRGSSSEPW